MKKRLFSILYFLFSSKGQSLVELIFALGILASGMFAVIGLAFFNYNNVRSSVRQTTAVNLAREGVEIVRNLRDTERNKNRDQYGNLRRAVLHPPSHDMIGRLFLDPTTSQWSINYLSSTISIDSDEFRLWQINNVYTGKSDAGGVPIGAISTAYKRAIQLIDTKCFTLNLSGHYDLRPNSGDYCAATLTAGTAIMQVRSVVSWNEPVAGRREVEIIEELYDW